MGRRKKVVLDFSEGKGFFLIKGTELVEELPFGSAELVIEGEGFKINCHITSLRTIQGSDRFDASELLVRTHIEYDEEIEQWE